jgi:uncharacterized protein
MSGMSVAGLWRYPVKSMAGETMAEGTVSAAGFDGDRTFALVDSANRVGSAKLRREFDGILHWQARFSGPAGSTQAVRITHPDGREIVSDAPGAAEAVEAMFGAGVTLHATAPDGLKLGFAAGTLGGIHAETTEFPASSASPQGTFFDLAPLMIVNAATLRTLGGAEGAEACAIRLRPNLVVEDADAAAFAENHWVEKRLAIGPELVVRVISPCPRCVMPTLSRADIPADPGFLRRVAQANTCDLGDFGKLPCAGVYATVETRGHVRRGDVVRVLAD